MLKLLVFASAIALALGDGHGAATTQDCDSAEANSCAECLCVSDKRKKKDLFCSHIFILTMFDGAKRDSNISNFELFIFFAYAGIRHVVRFGTTRVVRRQPDGV